MVQAIENWADLSGTLRAVRPRPDDRFVELAIEVDDVTPVPGFPNLFSEAPGHEVTVTIERETVQRAGLGPGAAVCCRAQRTSPTVAMAHPDGLSKR